MRVGLRRMERVVKHEHCGFERQAMLDTISRRFVRVPCPAHRRPVVTDMALRRGDAKGPSRRGLGTTVHGRPRPTGIVIAMLSASRGPGGKPCRRSGCAIKAPQRTSIAHLHRPGRAKLPPLGIKRRTRPNGPDFIIRAEQSAVDLAYTQRPGHVEATPAKPCGTTPRLILKPRVLSDILATYLY
jgi:hypothetical protein